MEFIPANLLVSGTGLAKDYWMIFLNRWSKENTIKMHEKIIFFSKNTHWNQIQSMTDKVSHSESKMLMKLKSTEIIYRVCMYI